MTMSIATRRVVREALFGSHDSEAEHADGCRGTCCVPRVARARICQLRETVPRNLAGSPTVVARDRASRVSKGFVDLLNAVITSEARDSSAEQRGCSARSQGCSSSPGIREAPAAEDRGQGRPNGTRSRINCTRSAIDRSPSRIDRT